MSTETKDQMIERIANKWFLKWSDEDVDVKEAITAALTALFEEMERERGKLHRFWFAIYNHGRESLLHTKRELAAIKSERQRIMEALGLDKLPYNPDLAVAVVARMKILKEFTTKA